MPPFAKRSPHLVEVDGGLDRPKVVYCFAHAGGGVTWVRSFAAALPSSYGVCAVLLPGRESRCREPFAGSVADVARTVAAELARVAPPRPSVLYGQSLGALIAFEVARAVERAGVLAPDLLVAVGAPAPSERPPRLSGTDDELVRRLAELDPAAAAALDDPMLRQLALPALRDDTRLYDEYGWGKTRRGHVPVLSVRGADDPIVGPAAPRRWGEATTSVFRFVEIPGGHLPTVGAARVLTAAAEELAAGRDRG